MNNVIIVLRYLCHNKNVYFNTHIILTYLLTIHIHLVHCGV